MINLLRCKGCGCLYVHSAVSSQDFCQWCCKEIKEDPHNFKTLEQKEKENVVHRIRKSRAVRAASRG